MPEGSIQEQAALLVSLRRQEAALDRALINRTTEQTHTDPGSRAATLETRIQMAGIHRQSVLDQLAFAHPASSRDALVLGVIAVALHDRIRMTGSGEDDAGDHVRLQSVFFRLLRHLEHQSGTTIEATGLEYLIRPDWRDLLGDDG